MGRPLRMYGDDDVYFVTARTFQARFLLRPSSEVNEVIGGVLARAVERYEVQLYGFVFASNHVHLLLRATRGRLSSFMQFLLSNISRKVGRLVAWTGALWQRRFSSEHVLDDTAAIARLKYILAHGVKEGLVTKVADWPGLSCLPLALAQAPSTFRWFSWQRRWLKGRLREGGSALLSEQWAEQVELALTPLPCWQGLSAGQRAQAVRELVHGIETEGASHEHSVLGRNAVLAQVPHTRPASPKKAPRPLCHASERSLRKAFMERYRLFCAAYHAASTAFRQGTLGVLFPPNSFRPAGFNVVAARGQEASRRFSASGANPTLPHPSLVPPPKPSELA